MATTTNVYMAHEADFKSSITGCGGEVIETPSELLTVAFSMEDEEVDWTAIKNKGAKTILTVGRTFKTTITFKAAKDACSKYLINNGIQKMGTEAMTDIETTLPSGLIATGPATYKVTNPGEGKGNDVPEVEVEFTYVGMPTFSEREETEATE